MNYKKLNLLMISFLIATYTTIYSSWSGHVHLSQEEVNKRLTRLQACKKEQALEQKIEALHTPGNNSYEKLIPYKSYAQLNLDRYTNNDQIQEAYASKYKGDINSYLMLNAHMRQIEQHRQVKADYEEIINNIAQRDRFRGYILTSAPKKPYITDKKFNSDLTNLSNQLKPFIQQAKDEKDQASKNWQTSVKPYEEIDNLIDSSIKLIQLAFFK